MITILRKILLLILIGIDEVYADDNMTMEANNSEKEGVVNTLDETNTLDENNSEKESFQNCDDEMGCLDMEQYKILEKLAMV